MSLGLPDDPIFDPVGIVVWSIDTGIYDVMYSAWGWPVVEIVHFIGLCLLMMVTVRSFKGHYSPEQHRGVEVPGIYWHFVDIMWVVVYATIYII